MRMIKSAAGCGIALLAFGISITAQAQTFRQSIQTVLAESPLDINNLHLGIIVESVKRPKIYYQHNSNRLYIPASTMKLFTATAGLAYLKPNFEYHTNIYNSGSIKNGTLNGNLVFKFGGDPLFKLKQLKTMVKELKKAGIHRINGHVYIDRNDYGNVPYPPGWIWDDLSYGYAAPTSAIIINKNKYLLHFIPARKIQQKPRLKSPLPQGVADYTNEMITTENYVKNCPINIHSSSDNHYILSGCLAKKWGEQRRSLAIRDMVKYSEAEIALLLKQNHIQYHGAVQLHNTGKNMHLLISHPSKPLSGIIHEMLKESDNITANSVFKKLGETYFQSRGTWPNSIRALKKILAPSGIDFKNNLINDGAGNSRYNLISPHQLTQLLNYAYSKKQIRDPLIAALPIAGKDGTLKERIFNSRIHAKTGSMTGVTALAGYAQTKHHGTVSFAIILNGFVGKRPPYILLEDHIANAIANT